MTVFGVALTLRLLVVLLIHNGQYSDSVWYDAAASRLNSIGEYGPSGPSAWFPPGYPFFLAAIYKIFGHAQLAGRIANAFVGAAACVLVYETGRSALGEREGLLAAFLLACWPNVIFHTLILDSETLSIALFALVIFLATRRAGALGPNWLWSTIFGLLLGWAMLTRPVAAILVAATSISWWITTRSVSGTIRMLVLPVLVSACVIAAWTVRNHARFGEWIPVATNGGYNFWQTNQRYADGSDAFWSVVPAGDPEFDTMRRGDEFTKNREGYRLGKAFLRAHPFHWLALLPRKVVLLYRTDTSGLYEGVLYAPETAPSRLARWIQTHQRLVEALTYRYYMVLMIAAVAVLIRIRRLGATEWMLVSIPILLVLFHVMFHAKDRFHVPLSPALGLLAAITLVRSYDRIKGLIDTNRIPTMRPAT